MTDTPWAHAHRRRVTLLISVVLIVFFSAYFAVRLYRTPTCFDGVQNREEVGVDCGGSCDLYCESQTQPMRLVWSQVFEASSGMYNAVAYLENPNFDKQADALRYRFVVYDREGAVLAKREGVTDIRREPIVGVFASRISIQSGEPYKTSFEWIDEPVWRRASVERRVSVNDEAFLQAQFGTELAATISNKEPVPLRDVEVVVIVYDAEGNALTATQTYIDFLAPREKKSISFAWPRVLPKQKGRVEFLPRIPPQ